MTDIRRDEVSSCYLMLLFGAAAGGDASDSVSFWIAGRAAGDLKCSICGFAPRSISLTVNCPLMFYTLIILFTSSKCASSVHSFVFLSMCLAYPHAPLIMCPLREALFSQRVRFITMSVKRQWQMHHYQGNAVA